VDKTKLKERRTQGVAKMFVRRKNVKRLLLMVFAFVLILPYLAQADVETLNLTGLPDNTAGGYYVGPAYGNLNGGPTMGFTCDDFSTVTYVPGSFSVYVSTLSDLSQTKFGNQTGALFKYEEVAWLNSKIQANPGDVGDIQFAMWSIFDSSTPTLDAGEQAWITAASEINPSPYDFSGFTIYTPSNTTNQEFVSGGGVDPVPEPASFLLLGLGMLGMLPVKRLRSK
jgi:hypothetical protein